MGAIRKWGLDADGSNGDDVHRLTASIPGGIVAVTIERPSPSQQIGMRVPGDAKVDRSCAAPLAREIIRWMHP